MAGRIALDLKQFKHLKSDGKSTTLKHSDGHVLTIAHQHLSPESKEQLSALSKIAKQDQTSNQAQEAQDQQNPKMADGGDPSSTMSAMNALYQKSNPSTQAGGKDSKDIKDSNRMMAADGGKLPKIKAHITADNAEQGVNTANEIRKEYDVEHGASIHIPSKDKSKDFGKITDGKGGKPKPFAEGGNTDEQPKIKLKSNGKPQLTVDPNDKKDKVDLGGALDDAQGDLKAAKPSPTPKQDQYCTGGNTKMYADPDGVVSPDDNAPTVPDALAPPSKDINPSPIHHLIDRLTDIEERKAQLNKEEENTVEPNTKVSGNYAYDNDASAVAGARARKAFVEDSLAKQNAMRAEKGMAPMPADDNTQLDAQAPPTSLQPSNQDVASSVQSATGDAPPPPMQQMVPSAQSNAVLAPAQQPLSQQVQQSAPQPKNLAAELSQPPEQRKATLTQDLTNEADAQLRDIAQGHIAPKTYSDLFYYKGGDKVNGETSTLSKIGKIFGMLAGGIGAGLTKEPNAYLEMMNKELEKDLDAQKTSATNAHNFIQMAQQGHLNDASIALQKQQGQLTGAQAEQVKQEAKLKGVTVGAIGAAQAAFHDQAVKVAAMPEGKNKVAAQYALGLMYQSMQSNITDKIDAAAGLGAYSNVLTGAQGTPDNGTNPEQQFAMQQGALRRTGQEKIADANEDRHIAGFDGVATSKIDPADRTAVENHKNLKTLYDMSLQMANSPMPSNPIDINNRLKTGQALQLQLLNAVKKAQKDGVYKESEADFIKKQIGGNPAGLFAKLNTVPQIKELMDIQQHDFNSLLGKYGLSPQSLKGDQSQSARPTSAPTSNIVVNRATGQRLQWNGSAWAPLPK